MATSLASSGASAKPPAAPVARSRTISPDVAEIKKRFADIEKQRPKLKKLDAVSPWYTTEGDAMTVIYDGSDIKIIEGRLYGEMYRAELEYYYDDEKLYFAHTKMISYNRHIMDSEAGPLKETPEEDRLYFKDGALVRWLGPKNKEMPVTGPDAEAKAREIHDDAVRALGAAVAAMKTRESDEAAAP